MARVLRTLLQRVPQTRTRLGYWGARRRAYALPQAGPRGSQAQPRVYIAHERKAAQLIVQIADGVDTDRLIDLTAAVYMLQEFQPSRFRTDDCFDFALGHVLRREAGANRRFTNKFDGTMKAHYREMGRSTRRRLGELIRKGLGLVGLHIAQLERKRLTARADQEAKFKQTVAAIA
jgi:hypothetical protein